MSHHDVLARIKASIAEATTGAEVVLLRQAAGSIELLLGDVERLDRELSWERTVEEPELVRQLDAAYAALREYAPKCRHCHRIATVNAVGEQTQYSIPVCDAEDPMFDDEVHRHHKHTDALRAAWERR